MNDDVLYFPNIFQPFGPDVNKKFRTTDITHYKNHTKRGQEFVENFTTKRFTFRCLVKRVKIFMLLHKKRYKALKLPVRNHTNNITIH